MSTGRHPIETKKIKTPFGSLFLHITYDAHGATEITISSPQKLEGSTMGELMDILGKELTEMLR